MRVKLFSKFLLCMSMGALWLLSGCAANSEGKSFSSMPDQEFAELKKSLLFSEADEAYLRMSYDVLKPNVEDLLDVWYGFVGSNPHLLRYFSNAASQKPNAEYLAKVRKRFRAWVLVTARANFDRNWLDQQLEIGLRHHRLKKNKTDGVDAVNHIPLRHLVALHYPITTTLKPFLEKGDKTAAEVAGMYEAWRKAVLLTTILWSQPYVPKEDY